MSAQKYVILLLILLFALFFLITPENIILCTKGLLPSVNVKVDNSTSTTVTNSVGVLNQTAIAQAAKMELAEINFRAIEKCMNTVKAFGLQGVPASNAFNDCYSNFTASLSGN